MHRNQFNNLFVLSLSVLIMAGFSLSPLHCEIFESYLFPGEGRKKIIAVSNEMALYRAPHSDSDFVKKWKIDKGKEINFDDVRFRTIKPGLFVAEQSGQFEGTFENSLEKKWTKFDFAKGDTIQYLQYRAEGFGYVLFREQIIEAELLSKRSLALIQISDPVVELWIRVLNDQGVPQGWYRVDDETVEKLHPQNIYPWPKRKSEEQK